MKEPCNRYNGKLTFPSQSNHGWLRARRMCGDSTTVRQSSWAPIVGQKRLSSAFWGDTLLNHSRRILDHRAQEWNWEGNDIKMRAISTIGGAKKGDSGDRRRGYSELFSSESIMPVKQLAPTIAEKSGLAKNVDLSRHTYGHQSLYPSSTTRTSRGSWSLLEIEV